EPYLTGHPDPYCVADGRGGWHAEIQKSELRRALIASGIRAPPGLDGLKIVAHSGSGRVERLRSGGFQLSASSLRFAVGRTLGWNQVRSDLYELREEAARFVFDGRGAGHGVGLCQIGAVRMAMDGRSYREILAFYYPGTVLGLTAQGLRWQKAAGELIDVITSSPAGDRLLIARADRLARAVERRAGVRFSARPQLRVYPSVGAYRDATGEPGWVAASTRGAVIRLQPAALQQEPTLSHELMHVLLPQHPRAPLWFREGVVEVLLAGKRSTGKVAQPPPDEAFLHAHNEQQMRAAYLEARACVENLIAAHGEARVLDWLARGPAPSKCR
ncbi:MAG: hypothetical protein ABIZ80_00095, partial [Bryobacteraceae bacterium]